MAFNTLYEMVRHSVSEFASRIAFSMFEGDDVTYAEAFVSRKYNKSLPERACGPATRWRC